MLATHSILIEYIRYFRGVSRQLNIHYSNFFSEFLIALITFLLTFFTNIAYYEKKLRKTRIQDA